MPGENMHSYVEQVSIPVMYDGEDHRPTSARRPTRLMAVAGSLALLACTLVVGSAFSGNKGVRRSELASKGSSIKAKFPKITPKFVDWKKEDAGSSHTNRHLEVADALAKADGLAEKNLSPVPEGLLKEAQQAAEEQRSMPGVVDTKSTGKKHELPAGLEKMFQQAEAEQKVEKKAKEGTETSEKAAEANEKKKSAKSRLSAKAKAARAKEDKSSSMKLLKQVSSSK
ncbi:hypothetical protein T484DRAFT_1924618 [Baffinella frigidus]|nr:hypothetical protein T484DRAFT_1924618 [Cryptophyta sp. CCMP2293]